MKNIINIERSVQAVSIRIDDFYNCKLSVFIVEFLKELFCFDILKIQSDFIFYAKAYY